MEYVLEVKGLTKKLPDSQFSLKNITFNIPKGAVVGFIGENGAGKTTTMRTIIGALKKDHGEIKIFGKDYTYKKDDLKEQIGIVFDRMNFPYQLNVLQLSRVLGNIYRHWDNNEFFKYIDLFSLPKQQKIGKFSRGMSMKLSIATALSYHAQLLLLDEPTSGLDPASRYKILKILLDYVKKTKASILLSTHITSDIEKIADYLLFIKSGEIILNVKKEELYRRFAIIECDREDIKGFRNNVLAYKFKDDTHNTRIEALVTDHENIPDQFSQKNFLIEDIVLLLMNGERL